MDSEIGSALPGSATPFINPDDRDDSDDERWGTESTASLPGDVYKEESRYNRPYRTSARDSYLCPTDEGDHERLGHQYDLVQRVLGDECFPPVKARKTNQARVLDLCTGLGRWAMDYADSFPAEAQVTGVDLRVIQPVSVPPNCTFEFDNCEKPWTWEANFDFINMIGTAGCFKDVRSVIKKAYMHLEPGGILRIVDFDLTPRWVDSSPSNDGPAFDLYQFFQRHTEAAAKLGRPIDIVPQYGEMMKAAGFNVSRNDVFDVPTNPWPQDKVMKERGYLMKKFMTSDPEGMFMRRIVEGLEEKEEQVIVDCVALRDYFKNPKNEAYFNLHCFLGQKPENDAQAGPPPRAAREGLPLVAGDAGAGAPTAEGSQEPSRRVSKRSAEDELGMECSKHQRQFSG